MGAQRRLATYRERRVIVAATLAGKPQTAIAKLLGVSQPHVSRTIAAVKRQNNGSLRVAPESALDIIDRRDAGEIGTTDMITALGALDYTEGRVPEIGGIATDAYERGSWDDIEYAYQQDKLTFEEYSELFRAHRARQKTGVTTC
ncbi:helix-turn-helix domain-containing protein [Mycobacterium intracellulare]|uniref:helix-turn-helix domain-containing protein n=1 Tax=Mycobacterium intracellulare TaxID=1767 RepID=UPI0030C80EF5